MRTLGAQALIPVLGATPNITCQTHNILLPRRTLAPPRHTGTSTAHGWLPTAHGWLPTSQVPTRVDGLLGKVGLSSGKASTLTFRDHERYSLLARELQLAVNTRAQQDQQQAPS